jgi:Peptidase S46.
MKGIMEKEDPNNREFNVPSKLKELYKAGDFGRYAMKNGEMPVCFTSTNDITGGNSGSPVINGNGELIGTAFDGNWESLSGDISFNNDLQRCINVDIRYTLFILEKLGGCKYLVDEMTIVE